MSTGLEPIDLHHQGRDRVIGVYLVETEDGPALHDCGPASAVASLKANESATNTAGAIQAAYNLHKAGGYKQTVAFVATDGEPSDRDAVKKTIQGIASEIKDEHEFAISFLIVGNDQGIRNFLTELDDGLNAKHDIVDVKTLDEVDFVGAFAGALHD